MPRRKKIKPTGTTVRMPIDPRPADLADIATPFDLMPVTGMKKCEPITLNLEFKPDTFEMTLVEGDYVMSQDSDGGLVFTLTESGIAKLPDFVREAVQGDKHKDTSVGFKVDE